MTSASAVSSLVMTSEATGLPQAAVPAGATPEGLFASLLLAAAPSAVSDGAENLETAIGPRGEPDSEPAGRPSDEDRGPITAAFFLVSPTFVVPPLPETLERFQSAGTTQDGSAAGPATQDVRSLPTSSIPPAECTSPPVPAVDEIAAVAAWAAGQAPQDPASAPVPPVAGQEPPNPPAADSAPASDTARRGPVKADEPSGQPLPPRPSGELAFELRLMRSQTSTLADRRGPDSSILELSRWRTQPESCRIVPTTPPAPETPDTGDPGEPASSGGELTRGIPVVAGDAREGKSGPVAQPAWRTRAAERVAAACGTNEPTEAGTPPSSQQPEAASTARQVTRRISVVQGGAREIGWWPAPQPASRPGVVGRVEAARGMKEPSEAAAPASSRQPEAVATAQEAEMAGRQDLGPRREAEEPPRLARPAAAARNTPPDAGAPEAPPFGQAAGARPETRPVEGAGSLSHRKEAAVPLLPRISPVVERIEAARLQRQGSIVSAIDLRVKIPTRSAESGLAGSPGTESVSVRLVQRGAEIHVAVHTPDQTVAGELRRDLSTLAGGLERSGFDTDITRPVSATAGEAPRLQDSRPNGSPTQDQPSENAGSGQDYPGGDRRRQQDRPRWVEEWANQNEE